MIIEVKKGDTIYQYEYDAEGNTTSLTDDDLNIIAGEILVGVHIDADGKRTVSPAVRCRY